VNAGVFSHGHLLAIGTPAELRRKYVHDLEIELHGSRFSGGFSKLLAAQPFVLAVEQRSDLIVCRVTSDTQASDIVSVAVVEGEIFGEVKVVRPSLEKAFRQIVNDVSVGQAFTATMVFETDTPNYGQSSY